MIVRIKLYFHTLKATYNFPPHLQIHFDGKRREDMTTGEKKECVSIAVNGPGMEKEKYLGDKMVVEGTGAQVSGAMEETAEEWGVTDKIVALNHDTCSVNTGVESGESFWS